MSGPGSQFIPSTIAMDRRRRAQRKVMMRHLKHNYMAHGIEGGAYMAGAAFLSIGAVMPKVVKSLGGPDWAVAFTPGMMAAGFMLLPMLTAHRIERLKRHKPVLTLLGIFQRLPYLLAGAALWLGAGHLGSMGWIIVMLCPLASSVFGGMGLTAWQELLCNTIPVERRSSLMAFRNLISVAAGAIAGLAVHSLLTRWPGERGFALLHLAAFGCMAISFLVFTTIRETPNPRPATRRVGLADSFRQIPQLLRNHRPVRIYMLDTVLASSPNIMLPFMSIHAAAMLGVNDAYVGLLSCMQMAGGVLGNLAAGWLGDRRGPKSVLWVSNLLWMAVCAWLLRARGVEEFWMLFFLSGTAMFFRRVGNQAMTLEIVPLDNRVRYLAAIAGVSLIGVVASSMLSYLGWRLGGGTFAIVCALTLAAQTLDLAVLHRLPAPDRHADAH